MGLISSVEIGKILSIDVKTLQRWDNSGVIKVVRTPNNRSKNYLNSFISQVCIPIVNNILSILMKCAMPITN